MAFFVSKNASSYPTPWPMVKLSFPFSAAGKRPKTILPIFKVGQGNPDAGAGLGINKTF
jgi:hypothetical protein